MPLTGPYVRQRTHDILVGMYGPVLAGLNKDSEAEQSAVDAAYRGFELLVLAASAGGVTALELFLSALPSYLAIPVIVAQHLPRSKNYVSCLDMVLQRKTSLRVKWAENGEIPVAGTVYVAPQDKVTVVNAENGSIRTTTGDGKSTPLADPLFRSAAQHYGSRVLGVVLSGSLSDGARGAAEIVRAGGRLLVQSRGSALFGDMPRAALLKSGPALAFDPFALAHVVVSLVMAPGAAEWFRVGKGRNASIHW